MNQITSASAPIVAVFESASEIRIILIDNEPWFVAVDIAKALNFRNAPDMTRMLDDDEKDTQIVRTLGGNQELTVISESGLYHAVLASRKPEAKVFRKWVTSEVLPTIRKTGSYVVQAEPEIEPDDECRAISESESEKMRKMVQGIAHCLPTLSSTKVSQTIYGRIKSPLRVGRIDEFPVSHYDRAMQYLDRMLAVARQHNRKQEALDMALLSKLTEGSGVAA